MNLRDIVDSATTMAQAAGGRPVMLIGFQEQANLGLGYLAAVLRNAGYEVTVFDFEQDRARILAAARSLNPLLIGFSLIFQFYIDRFGDLIRYLRAAGIDCHFTMGGHFPSLSPQQTLDLVPELDSVVRFEGETTLLELVERLAAAASPTSIPSPIPGATRAPGCASWAAAPSLSSPAADVSAPAPSARSMSSIAPPPARSCAPANPPAWSR